MYDVYRVFRRGASKEWRVERPGGESAEQVLDLVRVTKR